MSTLAGVQSGVATTSAPPMKPTASGSLEAAGQDSLIIPLIFTAGGMLGQLPSLSQLSNLGIGVVSSNGQVRGSSSQETAYSAQQDVPLNNQGAERPQQGDQLSLVRSITSPAMSHRIQPSMEQSTSSQVTTSAGSSGSSMVYIGPELPRLPQRLVDKIIAGEYIDFNELPPARGISKPSKQLQEDAGAMAIAPAVKRPIPDFFTWAQCFLLYATVVVSQDPARAADLNCYMYSMAHQAKRFRWPSWIVYDQNFRQEVAGNPGQQWAKADSSVYSRSFLGQDRIGGSWCEACLSIDHITEDCPLEPPTPKRVRGKLSPPPAGSQIQYCRKYNRNNGECSFGTRCKFVHRCHRCDGDHPASRCPRKQHKQ